MVIFEQKPETCKHGKKISRRKKCCNECSSSGRRHQSSASHPSTIHASSETPAVRRDTNPELSVNDMLNCPFRKVCLYLKELDTERDWELISEVVLHFSLKIYGLPECRQEDLPLAVYLFIEDTFGIQSKIELCDRVEDDWHPNVVGVVFETIRMKYNVLKNDALLEGAEVRLTDNKDLQWIYDAMGAC